ncbi:MAG: hypothetical protein KAX26_05460 [Anaerolineae bacterium]|nr:hypothetical protein [Anaerolineae bacterium]
MVRKKKKLTRKQRKQQRREAIARKRKERGWEPQQAPPTHRAEVFEDMLPLFTEIGAPTASSTSTAEQLIVALLDTDHFADEPEFEEFIIDPMLCLNTFSEVIREFDIEPGSLDELPDEEREDTQMTVREEIIRRLLTDELRQDIINGLNDLRLRLKRSGEREEVAKAAALQSFLGRDTGSDIWPMMGLVQAIFSRSLAIGFELMETAMEVAETTDPDESDVPLTEKLARSSVTQKAAELLERVPGLSGFLDKHADKVWKEGVDAVFAGELYLELFSPEELETGFKIFGATFGRYDIVEETDTQEPLTPEVPSEDVETVIFQLDDYITELFTPERLDQLRARLDAVLKDPAYAGKWSSFLYLLAENMADEDAVEYEMQFLIQALIGEMAFVAAEFQEDGD